MFETLLNFVAGVIFGTIFILMILFFMMCVLWCRPVPRVPIAKNLPPNKIASEVEETTNWISIFTNNAHFRNWLQLKLASSIQAEIEQLQKSDDIKSSNESANNITFGVRKVAYDNITFNSVKTVDTIEGTAISSFPITISPNIKIETEIEINLNNDLHKKIKSIALISSSNPILKITIPYEKGIILIELLLGSDAQITFEDDIITEETKENDGKIIEKPSTLSNQEDTQNETFKKLLSQFLKSAAFKIDVDTVPAEEPTEDKITETDIKDTEGVGNPPELTNKGETNPISPEKTEAEIITDQPNISLAELGEKNNEDEEKNEIESEEKNDEDDDDDEDEDDDEFSSGKIRPMRREFVVDEEIQEIVDQATSLINDKTTTTTTTTTKINSDQKPQ